MRLGRALAAIAAAGMVLAGCGGGEKVGDTGLLDFDESGGGRVGEVERTTTSSAPGTTAPPVTQAPPPTAAPTTAATARPAAAVTIRIVSGGQGFDPFNVSVSKGTKIEVVNADNQPRTFTSDEAGVFDSGPIAPGAKFTYVADRTGTFNFHDETRPFAVGQLEVTP